MGKCTSLLKSAVLKWNACQMLVLNEVCMFACVKICWLADGCAESCNHIRPDFASTTRWQCYWNGEGYVGPVPDCRSSCASCKSISANNVQL